MDDPSTPTTRRRALVLGLAVAGGITLAAATAVSALPGSGGEPVASRLAAADAPTSVPTGPSPGVATPRGDDAASTAPTAAPPPTPAPTPASAPTSPSTAAPAPAAPPVAPAPASGGVPTGGAVDVAAADAGVVVVGVGDPLTIVEARPAAGWTARVEVGSGREVEVSFHAGAARVDVHAEREDGTVRVRVHDRRTGEETESFPVAPPTTTPLPAPPPTTPPTAPPTAPATAPAASSEITRSAAGGTVTIRVEGGALALVAATPATGWSADVHHAGPDEVDVRFTGGDRESRRVRFDREGGDVRERVEER